MSGYKSESVLLRGSAVSLGASETGTVLSSAFSVTAEDSLYFLAKLKCSALVAGTGVTFKLQHLAGDGAWTPVGSSAQVAAVQKTCADTDINTGTDSLTVTSHGFSTGDRVLLSTSGTLPTGLTAGEYWVIRTDANTIKLATSSDLAAAGTAVNITAAGSGTFRICQADYTVRLLATDSTDVAQLPLWSVARWVADTGSGDSCTVSEIRVSRRL